METQASPHQIDVKDSHGEFENLSAIKLKCQRSPDIKVTGVYTAGDASLLEVMVKSNRLLYGMHCTFQSDDTNGHEMEGSPVEVNKQKRIPKHVV